MSQARAGDLRGLKALVGFLGALIVLGTALVIGTIIKRIYANPAVPSITTSVAGGLVPGQAMPAAAAIAGLLPAGDRISGIAGAGGVFGVWVSGPGGDKLLFVNPQTGAVTTALQSRK